MTYLGDFAAGSIIRCPWGSNLADGSSANPTTAGTIAVYQDAVTDEVTAPTGITDSRGFDSLTGEHLVLIDTSANAFYAAGHDYRIVLVGAVIDTKTVNATLGTFSIENRSSASPGDKMDLLDAPNATAITAINLAISKRLEADIDLITTGSPWILVAYEAGTATELYRKNLYEADGVTPVVSVDQLVGVLLKP
jgi:hypothetical protein